MEGVNQFFDILKGMAPYLIVIIGLFAVLVLILVAAMKLLIPVSRATIAIFEMFRESMKELLVEQKNLHASQIAGLESRIDSLESDMCKKDQRIEALETELAELKAEDKRKAKRIMQLEDEIAQLKAELKSAQSESIALKAERDALQERIVTLGKTSKPGDTVSVEQLTDALKNPQENGVEAAKNETVKS
jgi:chromosome segregation ATPase